jgi:hypothetical protein
MSESESFEATVGEYSIGDKALYLQGVKRGEKNEQERIIKLLEEANTQYAQPSEESEALHAVIALIKGETNE